MTDLDAAVSDGTIETVLDQVAPEASLDIEGVRDLLAHLQERTESNWDEWLRAIERGEYRVVGQREFLLVLDTGEEAVYADALEGYGGPVEIDRTAIRAVATLHHRLAEEFGPPYEWAGSHPYVLALPADPVAGQRYVEAAVTGLLRRGLSPGQAWAHYGVKLRGNSRNAWAERCGYSDHSAVSEAVRKAESKLTAGV